MHPHTHTHAHTHTHTHACTQTHMHTQTQNTHMRVCTHTRTVLYVTMCNDMEIQDVRELFNNFKSCAIFCEIQDY